MNMMRESRLSLYSLLLFIFAYVVSLTLYNLAWTNESTRHHHEKLGSIRKRSRSASPIRETAVTKPQQDHADSVWQQEDKDLAGLMLENDRHLLKAMLNVNERKEDADETMTTSYDYNNNEAQMNSWDPQDLLDFAVVDLDETVADIVTAWLSEHPRIEMVASQRDHSETAADPFALINEIQNSDPQGTGKKVIRGYRVDLDKDDEFEALRTFWPKTKLIVVLRHPVRWFEDYFNRYIETSSTPMLHPNRLIGSCHRLGQTVCTEKADVAFPLLKLGKTMNNPTLMTREIVKENRLRQNLLGATIPVHPNPVFLVTWEQLTESNVDKQKKLVDDLEYFLGVRSGLSFLRLPLDRRLFQHFPHHDPHTKSIDICESSFRPLRKALMDIGRRSSQWIQNDFLPTTTVTCSQVDWFTNNLKTWMVDPCEELVQNAE